MELTGPARKDIRLALLDGYPTLDELRILVDESLSEPLQNITMAGDMPTVAFELIGWARARGRLTELVAAAATERPGNAALRGIADRFKFAAATPGEVERIVLKDVAFEDVGQWLDQMIRIRRRVCRIEPQPIEQSTRGFGTGFLVANDIVATCDHVAYDRAEPLLDPTRAICRFDVELAANGSPTPSRAVRLAESWQLARGGPGGLDFALIRLAEPVGNDATPEGKRGHLALSNDGAAETAPLLVLQHPDAMPKKLTIGTVTSAGEADRIGYSANTLGGSSGSPCLTSDLKVVAIHYFGTQGVANYGVRTSRVNQHLSAAGLANLIA